MTIFMLATFAQITEAFELASKGATMGGQALLVLSLIVAGYVIRNMHASNKEQVAAALAAHERQHGELLGMLTAEREAGKKEQATNHETLVRIATESATGLQASAAAMNGISTAMNSLRDTLHAIRNDDHARQLKRDLHEHS